MKTKFRFRSKDERQLIQAYLWTPHFVKVQVVDAKDDEDLPNISWEPEGLAKAKGVVQIIHGMRECIARYAEFATFLSDQGYIVVGHDHLGHGASAIKGEESHVSLEFGGQGWVDDAHSLRIIICKSLMDSYGEGAHVAAGELSSVAPSKIKDCDTLCPIPYFIFGHSMGSFVLRNYILDHSSNLAGVIVCGTAFATGFKPNFGFKLLLILCKTKGEKYYSQLIYDMTGGDFIEYFPEENSPNAWLCTDRSDKTKYDYDKFFGPKFSVAANHAMISLLNRCCKKGNISMIRQDLPMFLISGDQDPVGYMGKGFKDAVEFYRKGGMTKVKDKLYPGLRHEILNEPKAKGEVMQDILDFLEANNG